MSCEDVLFREGAAMVRRREREWLDHIASLLAAPLTEWPDEQVGLLFNETFAAPACSFNARVGGGPVVQRQWPPELFADHHSDIAHFAAHEAPVRHPVLRYYLATGADHCMQTSDVPDRFADERVQAWWAEWCGWVGGGGPGQLAVPLLSGGQGYRTFVIGRDDHFTAQEMALAGRLQRLLIGLDRRLTVYRSWAEHRGPAAVEVADAVSLTPRAVLELLESGLTAAAIGRRLRVAERTVQKHLQHCYAKLGVSDRLDAVLRARRIGLLGTQFPS